MSHSGINTNDRPDAFRIVYMIIALVLFVLAIIKLIIGYCKGEGKFLEDLTNPQTVHYWSTIPMFWGLMVECFDLYLSPKDKAEEAYDDWLKAARYVYIILMLICLLLVGIAYLIDSSPNCFNFEMAITLIGIIIIIFSIKLLLYFTLWNVGMG